MENLEIFVLTIVISILFIIFLLGPLVYAYMLRKNSDDVDHQPQTTKTVWEDKSPVIDPLPVFNSIATESISTVDSNENSEQNLQNLLSSLLKSPNLSATSKLELSLATSVAIKDMESNGIQFPEALKNSLIESIKPTNPA
jgi:preprotein translocase subunit SecG